jgi:hypothetical protein
VATDRDPHPKACRLLLLVPLQETLVFDGTVRDNIMWGRPEARERDVVAAAVGADAHGFISALPDGYDTRVGQRGRTARDAAAPIGLVEVDTVKTRPRGGSAGRLSGGS